MNDGGIHKGLDAMEQELARVRQFGFGDAELDRIAESHACILRACVQRAQQVGERRASIGAGALLLSHEAVPGIETELELAKRFIPTITRPKQSHSRASS